MTTPLSPGLAQAGLALLSLLRRRPLSAPELVSGLKLVGGMPPAEALALAQSLNWLAVDEAGVLGATAAGARIAGLGDYDRSLRSIVLDYVEVLKPDWLQNAPYGRSRVLSFAPPGVRQLLVEAGVAGEPTDDVVGFWDALAAMARGLHDDRMLAIGREGERLTLRHESERTGVRPRWVAIDSNQDGYDVLSVRTMEDRSPLTIEVKASRSGLAGEAHLTRREWDAACDSAAHVFHLWDLGRPGAPVLAVVGHQAMASHVPEDVGHGAWAELRVPFSAFANLFGRPWV